MPLRHPADRIPDGVEGVQFLVRYLAGVSRRKSKVMSISVSILAHTGSRFDPETAAHADPPSTIVALGSRAVEVDRE
jgi:hypothetical protein